MANLEGELSIFFISLVRNDGRVYRAISVSSLRKRKKEKSRKFFLLFLFTLVKVAAASISDSCPLPYVGQFFQRSTLFHFALRE